MSSPHYSFSRQSVGGLGLQDPYAEVHVQKIVQAVRMLNCWDQNIETVARESLRYSFHTCLPNEPTNTDFKTFYQAPLKAPLRITQSWVMCNFYGWVSGLPVDSWTLICEL